MFGVLIVDDEPVIREGLQTLICWNQYGFEVRAIAKDGREALRKYKEVLPDLIIVDIRMPGMDGLQLLENIRNIDSEVQFLILSGYAEFDYAQKAMKRDVEGYLLKPVDEDEIGLYLVKINEKLTKRLLGANASSEWREDILHYKLTVEQREEDVELNVNEMSNKLYYALDIGQIEVVEQLVVDLGDRLIQNKLSEKEVKTNYVQFITMALNKLALREVLQHSVHDEFATQVMKVYEQRTFKALQHYILSLLSDIVTQIERDNTDITLKKMVNFIQRNYDENLKLEACAELFNYNSAYLGKLFRNYTGEYFNTYLDQVRVNKAKELLLEDLKVYQVGKQVGYSNVDYFHSKFKKYVGISPSEYRKTYAKEGGAARWPNWGAGKV